MSNLDTRQRCPLETLPHLLDIFHNRRGIRANPSIVRLPLRTTPIQILTAHTDPHHPLLHLRAPVRHRLLQGRNLLVHVLLPRGRPDAEQQVGVGVEGGFDGLNGRVLRAALDGGVEAGGGEAGLGKGLGAGVHAVEVFVFAAGGVVVGGAVVEALLDGGGGGR